MPYTKDDFMQRSEAMGRLVSSEPPTSEQIESGAQHMADIANLVSGPGVDWEEYDRRREAFLSCY